MATGTQVGLQKPPNLTTTQRDALTSPQTGWCIYNTTLQSYEVYVQGAWRTVNTPYMVTDTYTRSFTAGEEYTRQVTLNKAGYTAGIALLAGPNAGGSGAIGKIGCAVVLKTRTETPGFLASIDVPAYPSIVSAQYLPNQASGACFDTGSKIYLKHAYIDSTGSNACFLFKNGTNTNTLNVKVYVLVW